MVVRVFIRAGRLSFASTEILGSMISLAGSTTSGPPGTDYTHPDDRPQLYTHPVETGSERIIEG